MKRSGVIVAKYSCSNKRRKRRKRNDDMGDLDICLIKEFASRPGFYDRSNPHFKDKQYNQKSWVEISNQLGYDAHLLKDRMYQLRNRYNLEKRRLDNLRLEDPSKTVRSPWPLFYHLTFLDGHIRPRRSYKSMMRRHMDGKISNRKSDDSTEKKSNGNIHYVDCSSNGNAEVKYETEMESEEDRIENNDNFLDPSNFLADDSEAETTTQSNYQENTSRQSNGGLKLRNIETLKRGFSADSDNIDIEPDKKYSRNSSSRYDKFDAFGKFLSASLGELAETKALELIERFTSDIVKALIDNTK